MKSISLNNPNNIFHKMKMDLLNFFDIFSSTLEIDNSELDNYMSDSKEDS